jgi:hypothetical protein
VTAGCVPAFVVNATLWFDPLDSFGLGSAGFDCSGFACSGFAGASATGAGGFVASATVCWGAFVCWGDFVGCEGLTSPDVSSATNWGNAVPVATTQASAPATSKADLRRHRLVRSKDAERESFLIGRELAKSLIGRELAKSTGSRSPRGASCR